MIEIGLIEDDDIIRKIICNYLNKQEGVSCTIVAESVELFYEALKKTPIPKVILSDIGLPGMNGIEGIRKIKSDFPETEFIMLTVHDDSHKIFEALKAGASGYLLKNNSMDEIKTAIEDILEGGSPLSAQVARKVISFFKPQKKSPLSATENHIVQGFVDGLSYKMISEKLDLSIDGVRYHIKNIYKKLHVNSKAEVIGKSLRGEI